MATITITAMGFPMATVADMGKIESRQSAASQRNRQAESLLENILENAGWAVRRQPPRGQRADLLVRRPGIAYTVEIKSAAEGRRDRLVPLFAQAVLESTRAARKNAAPLAIVAAPRIAPSVAAQVIEFARKYAPDAAAGVIDFEGLRLFLGPHLEELNAEPPSRSPRRSLPPRESSHLFSDLSQWMLKVLLAPELPGDLLAAPRGRYRNVSQLARAANVSIMSAFRFVHRLESEGYLDESAPHLALVRREGLLSRWQASAVRSVREVPMRFKLAGDPLKQLRKLLDTGRACLALFAAADALGVGFVEGVPPYVYVRRIEPASLRAWRSLRACTADEQPDLILRQAPAPQSIFRGMVRREGVASCDVLQLWVDVAAHPARGREQAEVTRRRAFPRLFDGGP